MSERECCGRCRFFTRPEKSRDRDGHCTPGECNRFPPAVLQNKKGLFVSWFPFVKPYWLCGEFKPREE